MLDSIGPGSYHVVVRGRNHMPVMSFATIDFTDGIGEWDFTTGVSKGFGADPMKDLGDGRWGLFAADANFDGQCLANDFNLWLVDTKAVATGYLQTDFNLDGQVTVNDFNLWLTNTKAAVVSGVPDP